MEKLLKKHGFFDGLYHDGCRHAEVSHRGEVILFADIEMFFHCLDVERNNILH